MRVRPTDDRRSTAPGPDREPLLVPEGSVDSATRDRRGTAVRWAGWLLWLVAAVCLGLWGFGHVRMWVVQRRAMAELDAEGPTVATALPGGTGRASVLGGRADGADAVGAHSPPAPGEPLATITIPRLGLESAVLAGVGARELAEGVGHFPGTPLPGQRGNVALAGHRDSVFRPLREVRRGDRILLRTPGRTVTYTVRWTRVVDPARCGC